MKTLSLLLMVLNFSLGIPGWGEEIQGHPGQTGVEKRDIPIVNQNNSRFSYSMWIPPTPSNEACVPVGCCLIPLAGCILGYQAIKPDTIRKENTGMDKNRWNIGIGYSGGVAYTGDILAKPVGEFEINPLAYLYWLNSISLLGIYNLRNVKIGLEIKYSWTLLKDRGFNILDRTTAPEEEPWLHGSEREWQISAIPVSILIDKEIKKKVFVRLGMRGYISKGTDKEEFFRDFYLPDAVIREYKTIAAETFGRGMGGYLGIGMEYSMHENFSLQILPLLEIGGVKEISYRLPENMVWYRPAHFNFTGIYLSIYLAYKGGK